MRKILLVTLLMSALLSGVARADEKLEADARAAMEKATAFMRSIATEGGYLYWYAEDLSERAGENKATATQVWVQPPGTPAVGMAFLRAYDATKDRRYLEAAYDAADALVKGQLESGGWSNFIDFDPEQKLHRYRRDAGRVPIKELSKRRSVTSFDDNQTQIALRFLMDVVDADKASAEQDEARLARIREALDYGLQGFLRAQYPTGAWPQGYDGTPRNAADYPLKSAQFPTSWSREYPGHQQYWFSYTLNDNTLRDCIATALAAYRHTGEAKYLEAAKRAGDFLIRAQLPEPQPVWAQQYNTQMEPIWARKFEPPAASGAESAGAARILIDLYLETGDERYMKPLPAAIEWFKRSEIAPGQWARFYELQTNKPLYFTKDDYRLVYTDDNMPTHYSFQGNYGVASMINYYEQVRRVGRDAYLAQKAKEVPASQKAARQQKAEPDVREVIAALDDKGRWLKNNRIESAVFIRNLDALSEYVKK